jgi:hypothetical protein
MVWRQGVVGVGVGEVDKYKGKRYLNEIIIIKRREKTTKKGKRWRVKNKLKKGDRRRKAMGRREENGRVRNVRG